MTGRSSPSSPPSPTRRRAKRRRPCTSPITFEPPAASFGSKGVEEQKAKGHEDFKVGHFAQAFADSPVKIDRRYETPTQHHNPIELFATTCAWQGDHLTIHESSQFVYGLRASVAEQLKIDQDKITVESPFIGGAFGSKGMATARTAWIAQAAKRVGRPVKLVATRDQGFTIATYRAETRHHVQLAADKTGKLQAFRHEGWEVTSRPLDLQRVRHRNHGADVCLPQHRNRRQHRPCRPQHARLHARPTGGAVHVRAGIRDGRTGA